MAINTIGQNGTFTPIINRLIGESRERDPYMSRGRTVYTRDCRFRKEDPSVFIKWCRRNFGERGVGWDFTYVSELATIEIWEDKFKVMYELWQN